MQTKKITLLINTPNDSFSVLQSGQMNVNAEHAEKSSKAEVASNESLAAVDGM